VVDSLCRSAWATAAREGWTQGLALDLYRKRKTEVREGRYFPPTKKRTVLFDEIAIDFLVYSKANEKSAANDEVRMQRLLAAFAGKPVADVGAQDVERLRAELRKDFSSATVNCHLALLKTTFSRAMKAESPKADRNPVRGVSLLKENNIRVRVLTDDEEARLLTALPSYLRPLVLVALHTGMRKGELAGLEWKDVNINTRTVTVTESKSGEGRRVSMNRVVIDALHQLQRERKVLGGPVFRSPEGGLLHNLGRVWAKAVEKSGVANFRFHDLRHTAASRLVMAGVDLYTVKEILGHKTLTMTQQYSHLSPEHQRQAVDRLVNRKRDTVSASGTGSGTSELAVASGGDVTTEKKWWTGGELNSRHRDFQSRALPTELPVHRAATGRREPPEASATLPDGPAAVQRLTPRGPGKSTNSRCPARWRQARLKATASPSVARPV
jgi:integrase